MNSSLTLSFLKYGVIQFKNIHLGSVCLRMSSSEKNSTRKNTSSAGKNLPAEKKSTAEGNKLENDSSKTSPTTEKENEERLMDRKRYDALFAQLDKNGDGTVDVAELAAAFRGMSDADRLSTRVMFDADKDSNKTIDPEEFASYMAQREKKLKIVFSSIDRNQDGMLEHGEVVEALCNLGICLSKEEIKNLIHRLDKNQDEGIDWHEWRDFFGIFPGDTLTELVFYWKMRPIIDIGEQLTCPPDVNLSDSGSTARCVIAGAVAGGVSRTATAPLDRVKIMLQVYGGTKEMGHAGWASVVKKMVKEGGRKSLWRGNGVSVAKIAPESAVKFGVYEQMKTWLTSVTGHKEVTVYERFFAGAVAGSAAQSVIFPMEVVKTKLAVSKTGQYKGMFHCARQIYAREGLMAFYRGYVPNILGIIPYAGIDLAVYESLKIWYTQRHPDVTRPSVLSLLVCGTISSTCGQVASYPFALVRTRVQAQATDDSHVKPLTMARNILKQDGVKGFYRGIVPNFMKVLPAVGISYVVYEQMKILLTPS